MQHVDSVSLNVLCQILKLSKTKSMYSDLVFWALSSNKSLGKLGKQYGNQGPEITWLLLAERETVTSLAFLKFLAERTDEEPIYYSVEQKMH